jgi:hypothetical protein
LDDVGRIVVGRERDCVKTEFAFGVVEDELVHKVRAQQAAVDAGTCFDEHTEEVALGERGECLCKVETALALMQPKDLGTASQKRFLAFG